MIFSRITKHNRFQLFIEDIQSSLYLHYTNYCEHYSGVTSIVIFSTLGNVLF